MAVLESYIPAPAYLCNKSFSSQILFFFFFFCRCSQSDLELTIVSKSPKSACFSLVDSGTTNMQHMWITSICRTEMMTTLEKTTNPAQVAVYSSSFLCSTSPGMSQIVWVSRINFPPLRCSLCITFRLFPGLAAAPASPRS